MKTFDRIVGWTLLAFGGLHITVSVMLMVRNLNLETPWSFAGGLAIVFGASLNLIRAYRPPDKLVVSTSVVANLLLLILAALLCWVVRHDLKQNPQVVVFILLVAVQLVLSARQLER
jgi:uncharacterized membrane protein